MSVRALFAFIRWRFSLLPQFRPIEDYALIGDCRSAALISRDGSIDWLCWPRFDSPAIFAALLDVNVGGCWNLSPEGPFTSARRYEDASNVLVTTFATQTGEGRLTDLFFATTEEDKRRRLDPQSMLIRRFECTTGTISIQSHFDPRLDFGEAMPKLKPRNLGSWSFSTRDGLIHLVSDLVFEKDDAGLYASAALKAGDSAVFVLSFNGLEPAIFPVLAQVDEMIEDTNRYWQNWASQIAYEGPHAGDILRSALALKLLTYAASGAVIAAPTTSLPEKLGAPFNWDYRFCWLRDASQTVSALLGLGLEEEASAFLQWMLHATRLTQPELQVMYSIFGRPILPERTLDHLSGYKDSRPVRIGNAAHSQLQLDVYGEVMNAVAIYYREGIRLSGDERSFLAGIGRFVLDNWRRPDSGIWETREGPQHFVHSKVMCWVALDRLLPLARANRIALNPDRVQQAMEEIAAEIKDRAFNEDLGSYTSTYDGAELDAAVLRMPIVGFEEATTVRMTSTIATIRERLATDGLVHRHQNEETGGEGAFLVCSFWLVQCLAEMGSLAEAEALFNDLSARANDVGLFSEEIDAATGIFLGNFPQAFTHIGLINAGLAIEVARARKQS